MMFHGLDSREQCGLKIIKWNWKYIGASVSPPVNLASKASSVYLLLS